MLYFYFVVTILCLICESDNSLIKIQDNGYSGIVVGFSRKIEANKELLENLENVFREASTVLYEITNKQAYFKEITFIIPKSWGTKENWISSDKDVFVDKTRLEIYNKADIFVEPNGSTFGNIPYTIQVGGCEQQGLGIHITETYLHIINDNLKLKARHLVSEWMKYRYGVFDEHGFQGDERYPVLYGIAGNSTFAKVTSCSNAPVYYTDDNCGISNDTGRMKDPTCAVRVVTLDPTPESSSFMFSPALKNLCGSDQAYTHDENSPTKHNALCFGNSISAVISKHKDMTEASVLQESISTSFRYVQEPSLRFVLAIDYSPIEKIEVLRKIVYRFLQFSIPDNSDVDFVFYSSLNDTIEKSLKDFSFPIIDRTGDGCISCALFKSIEILEQKHKPIEGSTIVLIATRMLNDADLEILMNSAANKNIRIHIVLYLVEDLSENELKRQFAKTKIKIQYIPLAMKNIEDLLYEALQSSIRGDTFGTADDNILIKFHTVDESKQWVNFTFPVDETARRDLNILFSILDLDTIFDHYLAVSVGNTVYNKEMTFKKEANSGLAIVNIVTAEVGTHALSFKKKPGNPTYITVLAKESSTSSAIIVTCWLSSESQFIKVDENSVPVILYAEVRSGNLPVRNAKVVASLQHSDTTSIEFTLADDGIGDPDITKNDGIYTSYITGFSKAGHYILTVLVTDNGNAEIIHGTTGKDNLCCGSFVPPENTTPTGVFNRFFSYGSLYVSLPLNSENQDFYPPSRIVDFTVVGMRGTFGDDLPNWRYYLYFEFSAPGGNYNNDKASKYEFRFFAHRPSINDFDKVAALDIYFYTLPLPGEYGKKESFTLELPQSELKKLDPPNDVVFFAIRAVDHHKNSGKMSNIIEAYLPVPPPPTESPVIMSTIKHNEDNSGGGDAESQTDNNKMMSPAKIGMIAGIVSGCILILIAVAVIAFIFTRRKRNKKSEPRWMSSGTNKPEKNFNDFLPEDSVQVPVSVSEPMSPIQSWPANVLMDHYDKVQEAKRKNGSEDSMDTSSADSGHPLKPNPIYEMSADDRYSENNRYSPSAPFSSSQSSLNQTPRHVTQV